MEATSANAAHRTARYRRRAGLIAGGLALLAVILLAILWDWNWFRPLVEARASAALGRPVTIRHFDLQPGRQTVAVADGIVVANPDGFPADRPFATIGCLAVTVDVMAYLHGGQLVLPSIVADQPTIDAAQPSGQQPNWLFPALAPKPGAAPQPLPQIGDLQINDGHAHVVDPALKADFTMDIATAQQSADGERRIEVNIKGTYAGQPVTGNAIGGALLSLRDAAHPYPVDLQIANGATKVTLRGHVRDPVAFGGADLRLHLAGPDMANLYPLTGMPLPKTPPFDITGNLDYTASGVTFRDFRGKVGSSDLEGEIIVDATRARPLVTANVTSRQVDLADLGGFIGSQPGRLSTPNQTSEQKQALARAEASPQLLPTKPIDIPTLHSADVRLKYDGAKIIGRGVPFDRINVVLSVDDGHMRLSPVSLGVGRGQISGTLDLTPLNDKQTRLHGDIAVQRVDLAPLLAATGFTHGSGVIGGRAALNSTGNSVASFAAAGNGNVQLVMSGGGNLSALLVDLSGLEFGNSVLSALGLPRDDDIQCFVGDWTLRQGQVSTNTFILDTTDNVVSGSGDVNLRNETLDYRLKTDAKHFSIGTLPAPIAITGKFKDPSIKPEVLPLAARGGIAAALGFLFPPAALLPTIQFGIGDDSHCARLKHGKS